MGEFVKQLVLITTILGGILGLVIFKTDVYKHVDAVWFGLGFFSVLSYVSFYITMRAKKMKHQQFISRFLFITVSRIILTAIFLAIYLIIKEERDVAFIVTYMLLYLFYTMFEIYHLVTKLRAEKYDTVEHKNG